jgi:hypothetical protein
MRLIRRTVGDLRGKQISAEGTAILERKRRSSELRRGEGKVNVKERRRGMKFRFAEYFADDGN